MLLQTENCAFSDPAVLEWSINPSTVPKPPVTEPALPPVLLHSLTFQLALHLIAFCHLARIAHDQSTASIRYSLGSGIS